MATLFMNTQVPPQPAKRPPLAPELAALARQRRRARLLVFAISEVLVIALTIATMIAGISERFLTPSLNGIFRTLPVIGACLAAFLPILFFGHPKRRNRAR